VQLNIDECGGESCVKRQTVAPRTVKGNCSGRHDYLWSQKD